ncbi:MAG TPA: radical SAM protein [Anaerolineales bacterium]|nr:radical SAM protein [Anaerolineales bacterium]
MMESCKLIVLSDPDYNAVETGQCDCDCDCACSVLEQNTAGNGIAWSPTIQMQKNDAMAFLSLGDGHTLAYGPQHPSVVLNDESVKLLNFFSKPSLLMDVPAAWQEQWGVATLQAAAVKLLAFGLLENKLPTENQTATDTTKLLTVWLHLTDSCNLRCSYCYLAHDPVKMSLDVGYQAIASIISTAVQHGYPRIKLKYAGGESLIAFDLICKLHTKAQRLSRTHGLEVSEIVLSNGTLLIPDRLTRLRDMNIQLMVSLDGLPLFHDRQRKFRNGKGSGELVLKNIDRALQYGIRPNISITVTPVNVAGLPDLLDWVLDRELPFSLNFFRENERSKSQQDLIGENEVIVDGMQRAYQVIENRLPRHMLLGGILDRTNLVHAHQHPCGAGRDYLAIGPNGKVSYCQMDLDQSVGTISDGDLVELVRRNGSIFNPAVDSKENCKLCNWRYWCAGGCPLTTKRIHGTALTSSTNCSIYSKLMPEALRLEGMRLLKFGKNFVL